MTNTRSLSSTGTTGWDAAAMLARTVPNVKRRAAGSSRGHTAAGVALLILGPLGLVGAASLPSDEGIGRILLSAPSVAILIFGFILTMWAAPDAAVQLIMRFIRRSVSVGRRVVLFLSFALSVGALIPLGLAESTKRSANEVASFYILAFLLGLLAIGMAASTLRDAPAIVSVTTKARGYSVGRTVMLVWCLACGITGTIVGAAAAHTLSSAAIWPSVTLALLGIFITVFTQRHKELHADISALDKSLAALHRELTASIPEERKLRESATDIEAALSAKPRGPLTLAPQALLEYELEVSFLYLAAQVTSLPVSEATSAERSALEKHFAGIDRTAALADFTWAIRKRLLHPRG